MMCMGPSLVVGLSPRVRGNPEQGNHVSIKIGTIPACAGEPLLPSFGRISCLDYPRVCGGTCLASGRPFPLKGLSPRVRGNPVGPAPVGTGEGTIPACAGEPNRVHAGVS
mgnify:CR=1 FL=1